jgi:hypothetical protein
MTLLRISTSSELIAARESSLSAASRELVSRSCATADHASTATSARRRRARGGRGRRRCCAGTARTARFCERSFIDDTVAAGSSLGRSTCRPLDSWFCSRCTRLRLVSRPRIVAVLLERVVTRIPVIQLTCPG